MCLWTFEKIFYALKKIIYKKTTKNWIVVGFAIGNEFFCVGITKDFMILVLLQYHFSDENTHITIIVSDDTILYFYIKYNMDHLMTHFEETPIAIILLISILNPANCTYHYYGGYIYI